MSQQRIGANGQRATHEEDDVPASEKGGASRFAKVTHLATDQSDKDGPAGEKLQGIDSSLLERIRKMLKLAHHPNTTESEAKQAIRASTRLLSTYNLTEADIIANESASEQLQRAGHSIVTIRHRQGKTIYIEAWCDTVGHAITTAFNVKFFRCRYKRRDRVTFTFYGLRDNTVTAAFAFEMVFNLALRWLRERKEITSKTGKNSYLVGLSDSLHRMARDEKRNEEGMAIEAERRAALLLEQRNVKRLQNDAASDPSDGIDPRAPKVEDARDDEHDRDDEVIFVRMKEGNHKLSNVPRVKSEPRESDDDSDQHMPLMGSAFGDGVADDIDDDDDLQDDIEDVQSELRRFDDVYVKCEKEALAQRDVNVLEAKREPGSDLVEDQKPEVDSSAAELPKSVKKEEGVDVKQDQNELGDGERQGGSSDVVAPTWQSKQQLVLFKETAVRVAEEYCKENFKVGKGRKRKPTKYDVDAYEIGVEDGRKIDLKRKKLDG